jgi:hypothetical protein
VKYERREVRGLAAVLCIGNFFSGYGSYLDLNFGSESRFVFESGSGLFMKNTLEIQMI